MNVRDDPVLFLRWFLEASKHPNRRNIGWEEDDLARAEKSWGMAALATFADMEILQERDRFIALRKQLLDGAMKNALQGGEAAWGYLLMEDKDWAPTPVIMRAIKALERENIRVFAA